MDKLDVYSDRQVPFDIAAFCRGRRHLPVAVALANTLRKKEVAQKALDAAHTALYTAENAVTNAVNEMAAKMQELGER